jgi:hypothetical protein
MILVDRHPVLRVLLLVQLRTHQFPLFSISTVFRSNNNSDLAPLNRPISLPLPPRPFDFDLAFPMERYDPRVQRAQLPFVPLRHLFSVYADRLCGAFCFFALASGLKLFPRVRSAYPIAGRNCADGRGCEYVAWWIVRRPQAAGCVRGSGARIDGTRTCAGAGAGADADAGTLDLLIGLKIMSKSRVPGSALMKFISALGPLTTLRVWS